MKAEQQTINLLLKKGVEVPITAPFFLRLLRQSKGNLQVHLPRLDVLVKIAALFLSMEAKASKELTLQEAFSMVSNHAKTVSKIVAWCVVNNPKKAWQIPFIAKKLRGLSSENLMLLYQLIIVQGGLEDFITTIRFIEKTRITAPMNQSPKEKTS